MLLSPWLRHELILPAALPLERGLIATGPEALPGLPLKTPTLVPLINKL